MPEAVRECDVGVREPDPDMVPLVGIEEVVCFGGLSRSGGGGGQCNVGRNDVEPDMVVLVGIEEVVCVRGLARLEEEEGEGECHVGGRDVDPDILALVGTALGARLSPMGCGLFSSVASSKREEEVGREEKMFLVARGATERQVASLGG